MYFFDLYFGVFFDIILVVFSRDVYNDTSSAVLYSMMMMMMMVRVQAEIYK